MKTKAAAVTYTIRKEYPTYIVNRVTFMQIKKHNMELKFFKINKHDIVKSNYFFVCSIILFPIIVSRMFIST